MNRVLLFLTIIAFSMTSCKKDVSEDVTPAKTPLITVKVNQQLEENNYLIIAGTDGQVLNTSKISEINNIPIYSEEVYEGENINIFFVFNNAGGSISSEAFLNIKKGGTFNLFQEAGVVKSGKFHLSNLDGVTKYSLVTNDDNTNLDNDPLVVYPFIPLDFKPGSSLFVSALKGAEELYTFFPLNDVQESTIDFSTVNKSFLIKPIEINVDNSGGNYSLTGRVKTGDKVDAYVIKDSSIGGGKGTVNVPYPGTTFQEYATEIILEMSNGSRSMVAVGEIPAAFQALNADATLVSSSLSDFSLTSTGTFDVYQAEFSNTESTISMIVHFQSSLTGFKLPELGEAIGRPDIKLEDLKLRTLKLIDYDNYVDEPGSFKLHSEGLGDATTSQSKLTLTNALKY